MLIRAAQAAALSGSATKTFEDRVLAHLRRCLPRQCQSRGEPALRELIQLGRERASSYHITSERDVCKFIDLMVIFGSEFDLEAWASATLNNPSLRDPTVRIETLYEEAKRRHGRL